MLLGEQNHSLPADSIFHYVSIGLQDAEPGSVDDYRFRGFGVYGLLKSGNNAKALKTIDSLIRSLPGRTSYQQVFIDLSYIQSVALVRNQHFKDAIDHTLRWLVKADASHDTHSVIRAHALIGWANMELENEEEAIHWMQKGLQLSSNPFILGKAAALFNNLASCYNNRHQNDSALRYIEKGLYYSRLSQNLANEANALNIRADLYSRLHRNNEAEADLEQALQIRKRVGDIQYIIADMAQFSHFYASVHKPEKGIAIALKGIELAKAAGDDSKLIYLYKGLAKNYRDAKQYEQFAGSLLEILRLKDSLYTENSGNAIAELTTQYELQKKENIIIQQENALIRNRYFTLGVALLFILFSIIAWLIYRNYRHVQQLKLEQALAEEKLQSVKAIQQAEEKERKRIAADLHDNLGSYAAAITSNVRSLHDVAETEHDTALNQLEENAQGIVNQLSDTIWVLKNESLKVTSLADRFKRWIQRMIQNYPHISYHYSEDIENDITLTPTRVLNIFLILKECINNAFKHSGCSEIRMHIQSRLGIEIRICDNGVGIQKNTVSDGQGIENIRSRARECDMDVRWESGPDGGTCITLSDTTTN